MLETIRGFGVDHMSMTIRMGKAGVLVALMSIFLAPGPVVHAQSATSVRPIAQFDDSEVSQPRRTRRTARIRVYPSSGPEDVYPRYFPGSNAVRECNATYVQEFRPSGTVIVPRMSCHWRGGWIKTDPEEDRSSITRRDAATSMPLEGANQSHADYNRQRAVNDDSHRQLGEVAGRARAAAGPLGSDRQSIPWQWRHDRCGSANQPLCLFRDPSRVSEQGHDNLL
jgi:hypothetical protein